MDAKAKAVYTTILGRNPEDETSKGRPVIVSLSLPPIGKDGFTWIVAESIGKEYGYFSKMIPKGSRVNMHVFGERWLAESLTLTDTPVVFELELVVKKTTSGRKFILVNLYLTNPRRRVTHEFDVLLTSRRRPWFVYTTNHMHDTGISVRPL